MVGKCNGQLDNYECSQFYCALSPLTVCKPGVNVQEWLDAGEWYEDCPTQSPIDVANAGTRTRKEVRTLTEDEKLALMKAAACSHRLPSDSTDYTNNSYPYIVTYHGNPGWFEDCKTGRQGNSGGKCCTHHLPNFFTWHRLLILQVENSLRQWDQTISIPYWGWVDYQLTTLPELVTQISFEVNNKTYRNPFYINNISTAAIDYGLANQAETCNYTYQGASSLLLESTKPHSQVSLFKEIFFSYFYRSWIAMDVQNEIPHDNVHDTELGNMPNLMVSALAPVFLTHHAAVEKYFLIWQKLIYDIFEIDYTQTKYQTQYFGCLASHFFMSEYLAPFTSAADNTNIDTITKTYSSSGWAALNYTNQHYEYDNYDLASLLTYDDLKNY
eukprot:164050_1